MYVPTTEFTFHGAHSIDCNAPGGIERWTMYEIDRRENIITPVFVPSGQQEEEVRERELC